MFYFWSYDNIALSSQEDYISWRKQIKEMIEPYTDRYFGRFNNEFYKKYNLEF